MRKKTAVRGVWVGMEDNPVLMANAFVAQFVNEEFTLTFGEFSLPFAAPPDEQPNGPLNVPVRVVARIGMTRQRLEELVGVLQHNLKSHDSAKEPPK